MRPASPAAARGRAAGCAPVSEPTNASAGRATSAAGEASCLSRPSTTTPTRSARDAASSKSCVTTSAGSPERPSTSRSSVRTVARVCASSAASGSSRSSSRGFRARARASATRCCSPPESDPGRASASRLRPKRSSSGATSGRCAEHHVLPDGQVREERVVLEHHSHRPLLGTAPGALVEPDLVAEGDSSRTRAHEARDRAQHGALPGARGPTSATVPPTSSVSSSSKARSGIRRSAVRASTMLRA